ncbi:MAG: hypothetical protein V5B33_03035 [Candidatus Accumulibacter sp. UW20]
MAGAIPPGAAAPIRTNRATPSLFTAPLRTLLTWPVISTGNAELGFVALSPSRWRRST